MKRILILLLALTLFTLTGCEEGEAPADHTLNVAGTMHKPGNFDPLNNCTSCHGATLTGGQGPSCYSCHIQKWP